MLEIMEFRHDWASYIMTPELFKYVFLSLIPEVIVHSKSQDEEQVRDHYDRGDDFCETSPCTRRDLADVSLHPQTLGELRPETLR